VAEEYIAGIPDLKYCSASGETLEEAQHDGEDAERRRWQLNT
jgi:predicted RNase H-like HicB family nuclease